MTDNVILETVGLGRDFSGFTAVNDVSLRVRRGTIHAIIGPNGAGKTTFFNLLTKFLDPTRGSILFNGEDITRMPPPRIARRGIIRSFQISAVFPHLTVLQNVRVALQRREGASLQFWRSLTSLNRFNRPAEELLSRVRLEHLAHRMAAELPYGQKRALELVTTLAMDPELILLDEPTQGMGHEDVERTMELVRAIGRNRTVIMVEHNMKVVAGISDCITVFARGSVLAEGAYADVSRDKRVIEAYIGNSQGRYRRRSGAERVQP